MANGLLFDADDVVVAWARHMYAMRPLRYDRVVGIVEPDGTILGGIFFHFYNGHNVEIGYYGFKTATLGIVRAIARIALTEFNASRCTMVTSKRNKKLISGLQKIGWRIEGAQRCYYGRIDCQRNTGIRLVMFREQIERLAAMRPAPDKALLQ